MIWARWALALSAVALLYLPGISPLRLLVRLALHQIDPGRVQLLIGLVAAQFATIALALVACFALNAAKVWSIWLARLSAVLLILFGIPWLLPSGLFVLYALHDQSAVGFGTSTPSNSKRLWWAPILGGAAFLAGVSLLTQYAPSWGLPPGSLQAMDSSGPGLRRVDRSDGSRVRPYPGGLGGGLSRPQRLYRASADR